MDFFVVVDNGEGVGVYGEIEGVGAYGGRDGIVGDAE